MCLEWPQVFKCLRPSALRAIRSALSARTGPGAQWQANRTSRLPAKKVCRMDDDLSVWLSTCEPAPCSAMSVRSRAMRAHSHADERRVFTRLVAPSGWESGRSRGICAGRAGTGRE